MLRRDRVHLSCSVAGEHRNFHHRLVAPTAGPAVGEPFDQIRSISSSPRDVPELAKPPVRRSEHDMQPVHVAPIVANLMTAVQPQLVAKGLAYRVTVPPDLTVEADPKELRQVLLNLLTNAIKFTERGGRITVDVATRDTGDDGGKPGVAFLRVSDTGAGIPRHKQESIFDPAVRAHRRLASGAEEQGRGLPFSLGLARAMGGDLRVRSVEGEGSVFTLSLRMTQDERAAR